jgi:hypothetical protein
MGGTRLWFNFYDAGIIKPLSTHWKWIWMDLLVCTPYRGENWLAMMGTGVMSRITFVGEETIPAPDPRIIALHAACAKVAHMSAAAEHLEVVFRDPEQLRVMTDDGAFLNLVGTLSNLMVVSAWCSTACPFRFS